MAKIIYREEGLDIIIDEITTNKNLTIWEALEVANIDMDKYAEEQGWDGWDPLSLELEY